MSALDDFIMSDLICIAMGYNDNMTDTERLTERLTEQGWFDRDIGLLMGEDDDD